LDNRILQLLVYEFIAQRGFHRIVG